MIEDVKHYGIFRVDLIKTVLKVPHEEIAEYCMKVVNEAGSYTTFFDRNLNNKFLENFQKREQFEAALKRAADEFAARTQRIPFARGGGHRLHYWCSVYKEGDFHDSHIHQRSLISGTYYPQTSGDSTSITFEAPYTLHTMHDTIDQKSLVFDYKPQSGDCLLWPAWLGHRVTRQGKTDVPRIAISFNVDYKYEPI